MVLILAVVLGGCSAYRSCINRGEDPNYCEAIHGRSCDNDATVRGLGAAAILMAPQPPAASGTVRCDTQCVGLSPFVRCHQVCR
jgi:hypothetical protein